MVRKKKGSKRKKKGVSIKTAKKLIWKKYDTRKEAEAAWKRIFGE